MKPFSSLLFLAALAVALPVPVQAKSSSPLIKGKSWQAQSSNETTVRRQNSRNDCGGKPVRFSHRWTRMNTDKNQ